MSKYQKPFEKHIESNAFNINPLINSGTHVPNHVLRLHLEEWLTTLPSPSQNRHWDDDLDGMQKQLRHNLATEIIERGFLGEFAEQLEAIDSETLKLLLQYPITITMLSQDYFRQNGYPYGWEIPDVATEEETIETPTSKRPYQNMLDWLLYQKKRIVKRIRNFLPSS